MNFLFYLLLFLIVCSVFFIVFFMKKSMEKTFKALSYDLLEKNQMSFLQLAKTSLERQQEDIKYQMQQKQEHITSLFSPLKDTLMQLQEHNREIEKERKLAYGSLLQQVSQLSKTHDLLQQQTHNLHNALKSPNVRGMWGQIHLKRVVELAGLSSQCDFFEQVSVNDAEDKTYRPDLLIQLPAQRCIVIDAKTPIDAYIEAFQEEEEKRRKEKLIKHTQNLKKHIKDLSKKNYGKLFSYALEYVILFLPAEAFLSTAIQIEPQILEMAASHNVILATPTTLIAILRAVAFSWKQENISKNASQIASLGKELYDRLLIMTNHFSKLGGCLSSSVDTYNQTVSSLESRVLVSARKLQEYVSHDEEKKLTVQDITSLPRSVKNYQETEKTVS